MNISENEQRDVADKHRRDASGANDDDLSRSQKQAESLEGNGWTKDVSSRRGVPKRSEDDANDKYGPIVAKERAQSRAARRPNIYGEPIYTRRRGSRGVC